MLRAYRWRYIISGVENRRFRKPCGTMISSEQAAKIQRARRR
jgi:hypothetical protein